MFRPQEALKVNLRRCIPGE